MSTSLKRNSFWLYRPLLNWQDVYLWAIEAKLEEIIHHRHFHVTLASISQYVDWQDALPLQTNELEIELESDVYTLHETVKCLPMRSPALHKRWRDLKKHYPIERDSFFPHLTIYRRGGYFPERTPPYRGKLILGPEVLKPNLIDLPKSNVTVNRNYWREQLGLASQDDDRIRTKINLKLKKEKKIAKRTKTRDRLVAMMDELDDSIRKKIKIDD